MVNELERLRAEAERQAVGALAEVRLVTLAAERSRELEAEREALQRQLPDLREAVAAADRMTSEAEAAWASVRAEIAAMPSALDWQRADHERHERLTLEANKRRHAWEACQAAPHLRRLALVRAEQRIADIGAELEALAAVELSDQARAILADVAAATR